MKKLLFFIASIILTAQAMAIPAKHNLKRNIMLADGTTVVATLVGDEHGHWWIADNGKTYLKNDLTGLFEPIDKEKIIRNAVSRKNLIGKSRHNRRKVQMGNPEKQTFTGKKKGLIILTEFADKSFKAGNDNALYNELVNKKGGASSISKCKGSVADYFNDQSNGVFELTFDVVGPIKLQSKYSYYGANDSYGDDKHAGQMVVEACLAVDDMVNFADYDWDNNGEVDQVFILYAGEGEHKSDDSKLIWPHEFELLYSDYNNVLPLDGVKINTYACANELDGNNIEGIGTICHEFSHCMGLPDVYDVNYDGNFGMNCFSIMDEGSYNSDGWQPCNYTAFERMTCGWLKPIVLSDEDVEVKSMKSLSQNGDTYIIYNDNYADEFFILENRQQIGWDGALPASGLLISHIDYDQVIWDNNLVNSTGEFLEEYGYTQNITNDHQRCTIMHADNNDDHAYWNSYYGYFTKHTLSGDLYPYQQNDSLTNTSRPAAKLYHKNSIGNYNLNRAIKNIKINADKTLSFNYIATVEDNNEENEGNFVFAETFDKCEGVGGNDDFWNGNIAVGDFIPDNDGWVTNKPYGANKCARFGTTSYAGSATTPNFELNGEGVLKFKAACWNASADSPSLNIRVNSKPITIVQMKKGEWTDYEITINGTGITNVEFISTKRFFLDEIYISKVLTGITDVEYNKTCNNKLYNITGMSFSTNSIPHGIYIKNGKKYIK